MSWGVTIIGRPEKIGERLDAYEARLEGQSRIEFEGAKPHLRGLVEQAVGANVIIKLAASGHANFENGKKIYGSISVSIEHMYGDLAV